MKKLIILGIDKNRKFIIHKYRANKKSFAKPRHFAIYHDKS